MAQQAYKIAILATDGFEQSELFQPLKFFRDRGDQVEILSLEKGKIKAWDQNDWGKELEVDKVLAKADPSDYDALILPGGQINPDKLRLEEEAITFIQAFAKTGRPLAAICHAPWLLIEAGLVEGKNMTSYASIRTDLKNAGAKVQDKAVVIDAPFISSRSPEDLDDFCKAIAEQLESVEA